MINQVIEGFMVSYLMAKFAIREMVGLPHEEEEVVDTEDN